MKTTLEPRPMYDHREDRIRAHVLLCWLALLLIRIAETATGDTWRNIRPEMGKFHLVRLAGPAGEVLQRTETTPRQASVLRALALTEPPRILGPHADPRDQDRLIPLTHPSGHPGREHAHRYQRVLGLVAMHELDAPVLAGTERPHKPPPVMRALYRLLVRPIAPDRLLRDGEPVGPLRVVHVPGHTVGSIARVRDDGVVFSGDALRSDKEGRVLPPDPRLAHDPAQAAASAEAIRALRPRLLLTGHGVPAAL